MNFRERINDTHSTSLLQTENVFFNKMFFPMDTLSAVAF